MIHIPDNATDTSLFCQPVQANGADAFKLALYLTSRALQGIDARIVNTLHDEIVVRPSPGGADTVASRARPGYRPAARHEECL